MNSFSERPEREHGQEREGHQDERHPGYHSDELGTVGGQRADRLGRVPLLGQRAGQREHQDDRQEPAEDIAKPKAVLYQSVLTVIPANAEPLLLAAEVNA